MRNEMADRTADAITAGSVLVFGGLTLGQWGEVATILAGVGAFVGGVSAGAYHVYRSWLLKRDHDRLERHHHGGSPYHPQKNLFEQEPPRASDPHE